MFEKVKTFAKENKGKLIGGAAAVGGVAVLSTILAKVANSDDEAEFYAANDELNVESIETVSDETDE